MLGLYVSGHTYGELELFAMRSSEERESLENIGHMLIADGYCDQWEIREVSDQEVEDCIPY
jgi:hypothetical protein